MPSNSKPKDLAASTDVIKDHKSILVVLKATFRELDTLKTSLRRLKGAARKEATKQIRKLT